MIGCIIQARMSSERLPGKVLMNIEEDCTILNSVIEQVMYSNFIEKIVVATTTDKIDDKIEEFLKKKQVSCFRGEPLDVLDRYYKCAKEHSFSEIVRITSDNPLIDPKIIDLVISEFKEKKFDYICNFFPRTFPQGTEVEIFTFSTLHKTWLEAKKESEREHVTPYIYNNPEKFKISNLEYKKNLSNLRWTVDREQDLKFVQEIKKRIDKKPIFMTDILEILEKNPDLIQINSNHIVNEGYLKSIKDET